MEDIKVEEAALEEIEKTAASVDPKDIPDEIQATLYLQGALPAFRNQLEKVSGVQAKRVLNALVEAPLEKTTDSFTTQEALDLFNVGLMVENAKFILFVSGVLNKIATKLNIPIADLKNCMKEDSEVPTEDTKPAVVAAIEGDNNG